MSLPKQTLPIFSLKVPSTGKKVSYRQFTVREEKILAHAQQSEDMDVVVNASKEIIKACVTGVKPEELALFDVEFIMTRLRAKSVGENIDLTFKCEKDPEHRPIPARIELEKIEVKFSKEHSKTIELYAGHGVVMKYPTLDSLSEMSEKDGLEVIASCMESVYTPDEVFPIKEQTREEVLEYLNSLTKEQVDKIDHMFFKTMPVYEYVLEYECSECGHKHKKIIKGLSNFFV